MNKKDIINKIEKALGDNIEIIGVYNVNGKFIFSTKYKNDDEIPLDSLYELKKNGEILGYSPMEEMEQFSEALERPIYLKKQGGE